MLEAGLEDEEVKRRRKKRRRKAYVTAVILMSIYYALAIIFYTQRGMKPCPGSASGGDFCQKWDVADAIYFATATMTTVGYGDLKPQTLGDKYVTIFFILFGFIAVMTSFAQAVAPFYQSLEILLFRISDFLMRVMRLKSDGTLVDLDGDGLADYETPPPAAIYYLKGVSAWLLIWLITQALFAVGYQALEPIDFGTAFYLCVVTATTVGYGDVNVSDEAGRKLFASIHILYSVSSLAALLNTVQVLWSERAIQIRKATLLERQLDAELIQSLDKDNNGLDKLEFVVGMLTKLEILHWDDVEPFLAQFDALDKDKSGRLDRNDLLRMVEDKKAKVERKKQQLEEMRSRTRGQGEDGGGGSGSGRNSPDGTGGDGTTSDPVYEMADMEEGELKPISSKPLEASSPEGGPPGQSQMYGGAGARAREMRASVGGANSSSSSSNDDEVRRKQRRGMFGGIGGGLPQQLLAGVARPRRPHHLRSGSGKVKPSG